MKMLRILNHTGDTVIEFDETEVTAEARAEAEAAFDKAKKGATAFLTKRPNNQPDKIIKTFADMEDGAETIMVPPIVAG
jgi:hypothetical protein